MLFPTTGARYYILHTLINACVVYCVFTDFCELIVDPLGASQTITHNPLPLVYAIHIYHVVCTRWLSQLSLPSL